MSTSLIHHHFFGNEVLSYLIASGLLVGGLAAVRVFQYLVLQRMTRWASRTQTRIGDFLVASLRKRNRGYESC
jgi:hypothetical protein